MSLCNLLGHRLKGERSMYSLFIVCQRCDEHWDARGRHMKPAFNRAELIRQIGRGIPVTSAEYLANVGGPRLSSKEIANAWLEYTIETKKFLEGKEPPAEQVQELRKLAKEQPDEFIKMILGE